MSTKILNFFDTRAIQRREDDNPSDLPSNALMIRLLFYKMTGSRPCDSPGAITLDSSDYASLVVADEAFQIELPDFLESSARQKHREILAELLTSMEIPEVEHPTIIDKIFLAIEVADVPGPPLLCFVADVALRLIPKINSECLGKVRLDSLEDAFRREMCVICREGLDHFEGAEEEGSEHELMITRMPCRHLFHENCIFKWFEINHLCPLCNYPMPLIEEEEEEEAQAGEQSKQPGWRLNWPVILAVSTGGILSAMLVCRLWKQSR